MLAGIVLVVGVPLTVGNWVSERNVDQQASELAEDLRRAGRRIDDVAALARAEELSRMEGPVDPVSDALGRPEGFRGVLVGETGISVAYETSWGLARRCVHLLLRDDAPVRTEVTDSAACRPLAIG